MSSASVGITVSPQYSRTLDQFENQRELLHALYDAIAQSERNWMVSGVVHGNINLETIHIGDMHGLPGTRGVLVDNQHSSVETTTPPIAFQSVMTIARVIHGSRGTVTLDYVDDLESFYYVLAYICTTFCGPHTRLAASTIPSSIKLVWSIAEDGFLSRRISKASFREKETNLRYFTHRQGANCVTPYFSGYRIFETLLEDLHAVLRYRFLRKAEGIDPRPADLSSEDLRALIWADANGDYCRFKECIEHAIGLLGAHH